MSAEECRACLRDWPPADDFIADCGPAKAYLHDDQFFPGWTLLILKRHATELYELDRAERAALIEAVTDVSRALAAVYDAVKMNYELLGNLLPHIHWHLVRGARTIRSRASPCGRWRTSRAGCRPWNGARASRRSAPSFGDDAA